MRLSFGKHCLWHSATNTINNRQEWYRSPGEALKVSSSRNNRAGSVIIFKKFSFHLGKALSYIVLCTVFLLDCLLQWTSKLRIIWQNSERPRNSTSYFQIWGTGYLACSLLEKWSIDFILISHFTLWRRILTCLKKRMVVLMLLRNFSVIWHRSEFLIIWFLSNLFRWCRISRRRIFAYFYQWSLFRFHHVPPNRDE